MNRFVWWTLLSDLIKRRKIKMNKSILLVGVGGQGTILACNIVADALVRSGFDLKKSEIHGMAQRGGSVTSHICYGEKVYSPVIEEGEADIIVAFEKLEALRYLHLVKEGGQVLLDDLTIPPPSAATEKELYSDSISEVSREHGIDTFVVPGTELAKKAGNIRTANIVLIGSLSVMIDIPAEYWIQSIRQRFPEKLARDNEDALKAGRDYILKFL